MRKSHCRTLLLILPVLLFGHAGLGAEPTERRAVVFYTAETHGILEPCGCTSDPLGDFARVTALVRSAAGRKRSALLVDAGNLTYPRSTTDDTAAEAWASERRQPATELQAKFIAREIAKLPFGGCALGETDLASGIEGVEPKRLAANLTNASVTEPSRVVDVGAIRIGVLGVVDPDLARAMGLAATDPVAAARNEVARLRAAGAEVVILLAPVEPPPPVPGPAGPRAALSCRCSSCTCHKAPPPDHPARAIELRQAPGVLDVSLDLRQLRAAVPRDLIEARGVRLPRVGGATVAPLLMLHSAFDLQQLKRLLHRSVAEV